uniref:Uncharacterized protein n=1 Tax=Arundo donax TaxID=35708 RepID=A0A0A8YWT1_ARUDO
MENVTQEHSLHYPLLRCWVFFSRGNIRCISLLWCTYAQTQSHPLDLIEAAQVGGEIYSLPLGPV